MLPQFRTKGNLQASILNLAHSLEITYQGSTLHDIFEWRGENYSIRNVLQDHKIYKRSTRQLARNHIMYLDQIIDNNSVLDWRCLTSLWKRSNKEHMPKWYCLIKDKVTSTANNQLVNRYLNLSYINNAFKW